jgi:hypothetical protein
LGHKVNSIRLEEQFPQATVATFFPQQPGSAILSAKSDQFFFVHMKGLAFCVLPDLKKFFLLAYREYP